MRGKMKAIFQIFFISFTILFMVKNCFAKLDYDENIFQNIDEINYHLIELSATIRTNSGDIYRISKNSFGNELNYDLINRTIPNSIRKVTPIGFTDGFSESVVFQLKQSTEYIYSILESFSNEINTKFKKIDDLRVAIETGKNDAKESLLKVEKTINLLFTIIGVVLIFVVTGFLTTYSGIILPIFPPKYVYNSIFISICAFWYWLTSFSSCIIYALLIFLFPQIILLLLKLLKNNALEKTKTTNDKLLKATSSK
jgi:hypothetical protein